MSTKKEANGRRSVQIEFEVHGTPEEVWKAIATGPGISSWFVPTEFEERDGKPVSMKLNFGPGMEIRTDLTAWEPPMMFATEAGHPGSPPIANEWIVEARGEGVCVIRIVQSLFASTDDWDDQLESAKTGLASFLSILQIYLKHFRGQNSTVMKWMAPFAGTDAKAWETLTMALGLKDLVVGRRMSPTAGVPSLRGVVEYLTLKTSARHTAYSRKPGNAPI